MEKGKKGSTIPERLRHLGDYAKRAGVAALVACGVAIPSAACSLEGDPVDHQITAYLYCEDGDGDPNTNPTPELLEVNDRYGGNRRAGAGMFTDNITFACSKGTSAHIRNIFQKRNTEGGVAGDSRYDISIHCPGNVENPVIDYYTLGMETDGPDEAPRAIRIKTNGYCDVTDAGGPY